MFCFQERVCTTLYAPIRARCCPAAWFPFRIAREREKQQQQQQQQNA